MPTTARKPLARLAVLAALAGAALAQNSNATCITDSWMTNDLGQSPCIVASYLQGVCSDTTFDVSALEPDHHYVGPSDSTEANPCICSSVTYSLISACTFCQAANVTQKWSSWSQACSASETFVAKLGKPVPGGTSVPQWAFQDVTNADTFDVSIAYSVYQKNLADVTAGKTVPSGGSSTKKKSNLPVIIGAAVGGVVVVAAIGLLIDCIMCRNRRPKPVYMPPPPTPFVPHTTGGSGGMQQHRASVFDASMHGGPMSPPMSPYPMTPPPQPQPVFPIQQHTFAAEPQPVAQPLQVFPSQKQQFPQPQTHLAPHPDVGGSHTPPPYSPSEGPSSSSGAPTTFYGDRKTPL